MRNGRNTGSGGGRNKGSNGGFGLGPSGECVCPECGKIVPHQRGVPCYEQTCPNCGAKLIRKE